MNGDFADFVPEPPSFYHEGQPPVSLLLYLQSAPPNVILRAFVMDCEARGLFWSSLDAQRLAVYSFIQHPASSRYPPRTSTLRTFLKNYINMLEEVRVDVVASRRSTARSDLMNKRGSRRGSRSDNEDDDQDSIEVQLMDSYIHLSANTQSDNSNSMCYKTFFNTYADDDDDVYAHSRSTAAMLARFCPVRVASGQFTNVGLSLWPAAFVLVQLLTQELKGLSDIFTRHLFPGVQWPRPPGSPPLDVADRLRVLELGAGVGLTPVLLHKVPAYKQSVASSVLTDYQESLVENIESNLDLNGVTLVGDLRTSTCGRDGGKERPFHTVAVMDWTQCQRNQELLVNWGSDLILAADCIYDMDVIPGLAKTIKLALTTPSVDTFRDKVASRMSSESTSSSTTSTSHLYPRQRTCVVVQTHRQNSTMKAFFDQVRTFAQVESYTLVRGSLQELGPRRAECSSRREKATPSSIIYPLGVWPAAEEDSSVGESLVCGLQPDEVLSDGSLRSHHNNEALRSSNGNDSINSNGAGESTAAASLPHPSGTSKSTGDTPASSDSSLPPLIPDRDLHVTSLLQAEMIGPFYTAMVGLIGVHVLRLTEKGLPSRS